MKHHKHINLVLVWDHQATGKLLSQFGARRAGRVEISDHTWSDIQNTGWKLRHLTVVPWDQILQVWTGSKRKNSPTEWRKYTIGKKKGGLLIKAIIRLNIKPMFLSWIRPVYKADQSTANINTGLRLFTTHHAQHHRFTSFSGSSVLLLFYFNIMGFFPAAGIITATIKRLASLHWVPVSRNENIVVCF